VAEVPLKVTWLFSYDMKSMALDFLEEVEEATQILKKVNIEVT
jgi:hypothetical protein